MIWLIVLHHIGDTLQPTWLIENKKKHAFAIYEHAMAWTGFICLGLLAIDRFDLWNFFFLFIGHFIIDYFKYKKTEYKWTYLDQALHYIQLVIVYAV